MNEVEELKKTIVQLQNKIIDLQIKLKDSKRIVRNLYDNYLKEYLDQESSVNFINRETKDCYYVYLQTREQLGINDSNVATIRLFNKMVRSKFSNLTIRHKCRDNENIYIWIEDNSLESEY